MTSSTHPLHPAKKTLDSPQAYQAQAPLSDKKKNTINACRKKIASILTQKNTGRLLILGPCSIDNPETALEYAQRIATLQQSIGDTLLLVMRTYVEKPRTTIGWPGFLYDPTLSGKPDLEQGILTTRQLLLSITDLGVPVAAELLQPILTPYYSDLISYASIGARTSESQVHRQLASQLTMPTGIKNPTSGDLTVAAHSVFAATQSWPTLSVNDCGQLIEKTSDGNSLAHLILRGGRSQANYTTDALTEAVKQLQKHRCPDRFIVDCSHGNSGGCEKEQAKVAKHLISESIGNPHLAGIMLESYLVGGRQCANEPRRYGQSLTDACLSWETTESLVWAMAEAQAKFFQVDSAAHTLAN